MSVDALKALTQKLKKDKVELAGEKKFVTKAELEAARLKKLRDEEAAAAQRKELKRKLQQGQEAEQQAASKAAKPDANQEQLLPDLTREEVIRRLRALGQPATLFGEEDAMRVKRLLKAEEDMHVEDEKRGGQQENVLLELQRQSKAKGKAKELGGGAAGGAAPGGSGGKGHDAADARAKARGEEDRSAPVAGPSGVPPPGSDPATEEEQQTLEAFKKAAALLAEKRQEENMSVEERIAKAVRRWMKEWEADLEKRPDSVKATPVGYQATMMFGQTKKYLQPLYDRLRHKALHEEVRAGLWMMVQAMRDRNYLHANDIYLRLAIGNAAWPIGVTSVGIHERSAREKISHVMNESGQAHIMNDEATRKFLQALKRLISAVQRLYPTVPSRSVDFETTADPGRGMSGAGSNKLALLQAEQQGETAETLGLPAAPHFLEKDGSVMVPPKWKNILARAQDLIRDGPGREGSPAPVRPQSPAVPDGSATPDAPGSASKRERSRTP